VQDEDIWRDLNADELGASQGAAQHSGADAASQGGSAISSIPAYLVKPVRTRPPRKQPTEVADLLARLCSGDKLVHKVAFEEACMGIYKRDRRSKKKLEQEAPGSEAEEGHDRNGGGNVAPSAAAKTFGHTWRETLRDAAVAALFHMRRANPGTPDATPRGPVSIVTDRVVAAKTPKAEDVLRAVAASDAAAALMNTGLAGLVGRDSLPTWIPLPKNVFERIALSHESKKITNDGLNLAAAAHGKRMAKPVVDAAIALLFTVEKVSYGPLRNTMDLSAAGYVDLLLTHPDFGPNSPTSHLPSVVRAFVADALLIPTGARMGGRKIPEYSQVPRHATLHSALT
jgi:hypothetical protein